MVNTNELQKLIDKYEVRANKERKIAAERWSSESDAVSRELYAVVADLKELLNDDKGDENERLKTLLYNAVTLVVDETYEQYDDVDEWKRMMFNELGTTEEELHKYDVHILV